MLLLVLSLFWAGRSQAQIALPLGAAAHYGLLSGASISIDSTTAGARGKAGAAGTIGANVHATDSLLAGGVGSVGIALADLQAAITYCQGLTAQAVTTGSILKPTPDGVYQFTGNVTLDSTVVLHLVGADTTWHIFRISGNLTTTESGRVTLADGVRTDHVIWQVSGTVTQEALSRLPGIVLAGGAVTVTDVQFGAQTLLALDSISFTAQEPTLGRAVYSASTGLGLPPAPLTECGGESTCDPDLGRNELANGDAEDHVPVLPNVGDNNMAPGMSVVDCWSAVTHDASPNYFHETSPPPTSLPAGATSVGIPTNYFGVQAAHSGDGYMGLYGYAQRVTTSGGDRLYDYIRHPLQTGGELEAGRWYYGEFYISQGEISRVAVNNIGMFLANEVPPPLWFNNGAEILRRTPPLGNHATSPLAIPQIRSTAVQSNRVDWVRISGAFQATGLERCVVIGTFVPQGPPLITSNRSAYYYVDDISLSAFPQPQIAERLVKCGGQVLLSSEDCLLPYSSGAEYQWTSDGGFVSGWLPTPEATDYPIQSVSYTLSVRVPIIDQPGNFHQSSMSAGEVEVITPSCQLDCLGGVGTTVQSVYTLLNDSYILNTRNVSPYATSNVFTFPMYGVFHVDSDLSFTGGGTVIIPEGTILLMDPNTKIELNNTTLIVAGGTITAACFREGLWDGIYALDAACVVRTQESDENMRHPEISGMSEGIQLNNPPNTPGASGSFSFEDTRFRNNVKTLTSLVPINTTAPAGGIWNCSFDAELLILGDRYPLWHVSLSGNRLQTSIRSSTFDHAWFGLYAGGILRLGNASNTSSYRVDGNTFRHFYLAGVYAATNAISPNINELHLDNNTFELYTEASIPDPATYTNYSTALGLLASAHTAQFQDQTTLVPTTFGVFTERATVTLTHNVFRQALGYPDYDYAAHRSPQIGAYVHKALTDAKIVSNEFLRLHEGLRGLHAPSSFVQNNLFDDCKIGAHVLANSASVNPICLDCNTFRRGAWSSPHSVYGVSHGVLIDQGAVVSLERHEASGPPQNRVLGNRFLHTGRTVAQFNGTTWPATTPTFNGYDNSIVNNSGASLEYLTYDDDNVTTTNYYLEHAPAAVHQSWTGSAYNGSTNLTVLTPGMTQPNSYKVLSSTDCSTRPEAFTQGLLERYVDPKNEPSGALLAVATRLLKARPTLICYPNPADGSTKLEYSLPTESSQVRIEVRDLTGRLLLTQPVNGRVDTGEIQLSLTGLPTGILSCQLIVDGAVHATQRLIHSLNGRL